MRIKIKDNASSDYMASLNARGSWYTPSKNEREFYRMLLLIDGQTLEVDTKHLFCDQYNTMPIEGVSDNGLRIMQRQVSEVIDDIRNTVGECGFCRNQTPNQIEGFCQKCLDSPYLKEQEVKKGANRIRPVGTKRRKVNWIELSPEEWEKIKPLYLKRQTTGATSRNTQRIKKQRADLLKDCEKSIKKATTKRDGMLWLMDHGISIDNCIYYDHSDTFCFGWRSPLSDSVKNELITQTADFPFCTEFK